MERERGQAIFWYSVFFIAMLFAAPHSDASTAKVSRSFKKCLDKLTVKDFRACNGSPLVVNATEMKYLKCIDAVQARESNDGTANYWIFTSAICDEAVGL